MGASTPHIIGYVDPLIISAGDQIAVKVSCGRSNFKSQVLRLGPGFNHPDAPPVKHQLVDSIPPNVHPSRLQFSRPGSFARISSWKGSSLDDADSLSIRSWFQATLPEGAGHDQFLFSSINSASGFACLLDAAGSLRIHVGGSTKTHELNFSTKLLRHQWYQLHFTFDLQNRNMKLKVQTKGRDIGEASIVHEEEQAIPKSSRIASTEPLTIAGDSRETQISNSPIKSSSFNGKIDGFMLTTTSNKKENVLLNLDFSLRMSTDQIEDISGYKCHGELVNAPARAVTGHDWDASQNDWRRASYGYGAIHFHDDDLDDAGWETDFELEIPLGLKSGCYGVHIDDEHSSDIVPFFVRPDPEAAKVPAVALIIPTFTYTAYANEHLYDSSREAHFAAEPVTEDEYFTALEDRPDLGISLYDSHSDGSGTVFSSLKRPVLNFRSGYSHWAFVGTREFPADLWYVGFLERELGEDDFDIITDHDISQYGDSLLKRYKVLLSCSHPEYPTYNMLNAYESFLKTGGHFMYLGGNGYYWVTAHDNNRPHRIEVRRMDQGCRTFGLPAGNWHNSMTGEQGGLWRARGRPPNQLFGLGSSAIGIGQGAAYGISDEARSDPRLSFLFRGAGLESTSVIGDFGLVQGAASGDEIDRLDYSLGTPQNAVIIATTKLAGGHSDNYALFNEESMFPMINTTGTTSDKVRSDLIFFETASGGAVFSVGSMNWVGALAWKGYDNNVAQITANALHEFIRRGELSKRMGD